MKNSKTGDSIVPWTLFLFCMALFFMQYKGREKATKVVEFVAKWLNLCLSTVSIKSEQISKNTAIRLFLYLVVLVISWSQDIWQVFLVEVPRYYLLRHRSYTFVVAKHSFRCLLGNRCRKTYLFRYSNPHFL